jgi:hypothetical protein
LYLNCNENYNEKNYILQQIKNNKILLNEYCRIKVKLSKSLEKFKETNTHPQFDSFFDVNDRILITENIIDFLMDKQIEIEKHRINNSTFNKLEIYIFQFQNAISNEKIIELKEIVSKGCIHFENIYLSQKQRLSKSKLTDHQKNNTPYINEVLEIYEGYKKLLNDIENKLNTTKTTQPELTRTKIFTFKNNFDSVNTEIVHKHFKENLVDKNYLSIDVLEQFLIMAFQEQRQLENKFTFDKHTTQKTIIKIFNDYYKIIAQKPYGKKPKYVELLCNYFVGYDAKKIHSNFSR